MSEDRACTDDDLRDTVLRLAHEIRHPLAAIKSAVQLLEHLQAADAAAQEFYGSILTEIHRIESVFDDLQRSVRSDYHAAQEVKVGEHSAAAVERISNSAGVEDWVAIEGGPTASVIVEPEHFETAIVELLDNGLRFSPEPEPVTVGWREEEASIVISVRDRGGGITLFPAVKRDVTREVRLEAQYLQAQKLENLGRLVSGFAQDFDNRLHAIHGYCEIGLAEVAPSDPTTDILQEIISVAAVAAELSRRLLTLSRHDSSEPRLVRLDDVVDGLTAIIRRLIGEDIIVGTTLPESPPVVLRSRSSLEQELLNLVVNARDAMPDDGTIMIGVDRRRLRRRRLRG